MLAILPLLLLVPYALASSIPAIRPGIKHRGRSTQIQIPLSPHKCNSGIKPRVFIISMFDSEEEAWYSIPDFNILDQNISVPGLSPLFPNAHCTSNGTVCQMTTGQGEINAAASMTALWMSNCFDLTSTYFLIAGVGGIDPHIANTGSVAFARYAVQFDLQYEFSQSQVPSNASSGYYPQAAEYPDEENPRDYPGEIYGTEAFELNNNLKTRAVQLAKRAILNDTAAAQAYRSKYPYAPANQPPTVVECDSGTSNNHWSGSVLGNAFAAYTKLLTNGSGTYCNTQQEDNDTGSPATWASRG